MYVVARTDAGLVRDQNQDRYLAWTLDVDGEDRASRFQLFAVADGMGGSAAGDRASTMTLQVLAERLLPQLCSGCGEPAGAAWDISKLLRESVLAANAAVLAAAEADPALEGMGTTLTAGLVSRGVLYLAQVGDSRCYRARAGKVEQLTTDHSVVGELVRMGKLSPEDARSHPRRNIITRAVGVSDILEVEITCQALEEKDVYLLCSDGLWELLPDERIEQVLCRTALTHGNVRSVSALSQACDDLVRAALAEGGDDNVTVLLAAARPEDLHPDAAQDVQAFSRTRVESGGSDETDLKRTLRYRLQEWQQ